MLLFAGIAAAFVLLVYLYVQGQKVQIKAGLWMVLKPENLGDMKYAPVHHFIRTMKDLKNSDIEDSGLGDWWTCGYFNTSGDAKTDNLQCGDPRVHYDFVSATEQDKLEYAWKKALAREADRILKEAKERRDTAYVAFVTGK